MRKLIGMLLSLSLLLSGLASVAAQESGLAFADGLGSPVTWLDENGQSVASLSVISIDEDFRDYAVGYEPDHGYKYQLVQIAVENRSEAAIIIEPSRFSLVDNLGRSQNRTTLSMIDGTEVFNSPIALAPAESAEKVLVYQTPAHVSAGILIWTPETNQAMMVTLTTEYGEGSAIARGMNQPATYTDDFGNAVATFQVNDVNDNWTDYSEYDVPDDGITYRAIYFTITNNTDRSVEVSSFDFTFIDSNGNSLRTSFARATDDAEIQAFREQVQLEPDESVTGMLVFEVEADVDAIAVTWTPTWSSTNFAFIADGDDSEGAIDTTPDVEATPAGD